MPLDQEQQEQQASLAFLQSLVDQTNIVEEFDDERLKEIGHDVVEGYEVDKSSRSEWEENQDKFMELAAQVMEHKNYPWPNAANVKYPLITIAALQFSARAYQALLPNRNIVKSRVVGADPDGQKFERAKRIEKYMSYQLLEEMEEWEESMDRLCLTLPILGNVFKKTYQGPKGPVSELVLPKDLVVNYYAKSLEQASRKTHVLIHYPNNVISKVRSGEFVDHDYQESHNSQPQVEVATYVDDEIQGITEPSNDPNTPIEYLEQHTYLDLDDDGYAEPYIVTVHLETKIPVRIVANFDVNTIETNDGGEIISIDPIEHFTNVIFIPDPASGVYGLGLGLLLGPLNEAANTLINQLIDAGTLSNMPSGFIAKGIRVKHGDIPLSPGEWRSVNTIGSDLKSGIVPLPVGEPSQVLFSLLGLLLEAGQQLGSVTDLMVGESPGQNQPYSTTQEVLRQGMQVFSAIHKRIHRSLKKEFKKIYYLNKLYLPDEKYFIVLDSNTPQAQEQGVGAEGQETNLGVIRQNDFMGDDTDVIPASDPMYSSQADKLNKAQAVLGMIQLGTINPVVGTKRLLEAYDIENIDELMEMPEPQPSFEQQIEMQKLELQKGDQDIDGFKAMAQNAKDEAAAVKSLAEAEAKTNEQRLEALRLSMEQEMQKNQNQLDLIMQALKIQEQQEKTKQTQQKGRDAELQ